MPKDRNCYEAAIQALMVGKYERLHTTLTLCHGYPRLTKADGDKPAGTLYGHAWLETEYSESHCEGGATVTTRTPVCIDVITNKTVPRYLYYTVGRVDPALVRRYTKEEAWENMKKHRHNGPWHSVPHGAAFAGAK